MLPGLKTPPVASKCWELFGEKGSGKCTLTGIPVVVRRDLHVGTGQGKQKGKKVTGEGKESSPLPVLPNAREAALGKKAGDGLSHISGHRNGPQVWTKNVRREHLGKNRKC